MYEIYDPAEEKYDLSWHPAVEGYRLRYIATYIACIAINNICDWICENHPYWHNNRSPFYGLTLKLHSRTIQAHPLFYCVIIVNKGVFIRDCCPCCNCCILVAITSLSLLSLQMYNFQYHRMLLPDTQ